MSKRTRLKAIPTTKAKMGEDDFLIEEGIDAIDQLSTKMRQAGMIACADALDEVFVRCLRNYVTLGECCKPAEQKATKRNNDDLN